MAKTKVRLGQGTRSTERAVCVTDGDAILTGEKANVAEVVDNQYYWLENIINTGGITWILLSL